MADNDMIARLRDWLSNNGFTTTEGAVKIGISYTYFTQILAGKKNPSKFLKEKLQRIVRE